MDFQNWRIPHLSIFAPYLIFRMFVWHLMLPVFIPFPNWLVCAVCSWIEMLKRYSPVKASCHFLRYGFCLHFSSVLLIFFAYISWLNTNGVKYKLVSLLTVISWYSWDWDWILEVFRPRWSKNLGDPFWIF